VNTSAPALIASAVAAGIGLLTGVGGHDVAVSLLPPPVQVKELRYEDGRMIYWAVAEGRTREDGYSAVWRASLNRMDPKHGMVRICTGVGDGEYWDRPRGAPWSLQALVSKKCPDTLAPGNYHVKVRITPDDGARPDVAVATFTVPEPAP
jgi:hypothetical protein